jgi:hydroxymethylpyrimidine pyrophosphatase-like HAD family hydrolase
LDQLAADLGVEPAYCLAIGDGRNDIEMLTWAGHGVAMGNAPAEVQAAADAITDPVSKHGTATELLRWF